MATLKDKTTQNLQRVDGNGAARVSALPPFVDDASGGRFRWVGRTGLLTTIAADGLLFALKWTSLTKTLVIDRLLIEAVVETDFATNQRLQFYARIARAIGAFSGTGGAAVNLTSNQNAKRRSSGQLSAMASTGMYLATSTTVIGGVTVTTEDTDPFLIAHGHAPAAGTTVENQTIRGDYKAHDEGGPIVLVGNEGLLIRNGIVMGATGTVQLAISMSWRELLNIDAAGL